MKKHIYPYGIIGNCSYIALIDDKTNVQWMCWPYFDSSFIFGGMLDEKKGGHFQVSPRCPKATTTQYYKKNTNILVTRFDCSDGSFEVYDFAPRFELYERFHKPLKLFRKIKKISGSPVLKVECQPVGEYGDKQASSSLGSNHIAYHGLNQALRLTSNISKVYIKENKYFALSEDKYLVLSWGDHLEAPLESTFNEFYARTKRYWEKWVENCTIPNIYQSEVIRSALTLKLHQYEDTGAIIASSTTSLPEHPGSGRNWDYRYCWIRDSYFTLSALNSLSHFIEAEDYAEYLQNLAQAEERDFQPVYCIDGTSTIDEWEADLNGYLGNKPVRVGNAAYQQDQFDVYGQIILSLLPLYIDERITKRKAKPPISTVMSLLDSIENKMDQPDAGIWEYRGKKQKHCETYTFHWPGALAAKKLAKKFNNELLLKKSTRIEKLAIENIEKCYDEKRKCYTMAQGRDALDASQFLLITMKYLDPNSERAKLHHKALEENLVTKEGLVYRYRDHDDFGETSSTFLICAFWYIQSLACIGEIEKAQEIFNKLLKYSNHLGLLSEDVCPQDGSQWGNFAQTYSHVGLINTAFKIARKLDTPLFYS